MMVINQVDKGGRALQIAATSIELHYTTTNTLKQRLHYVQVSHGLNHDNEEEIIMPFFDFPLEGTHK